MNQQNKRMAAILLGIGVLPSCIAKHHKPFPTDLPVVRNLAAERARIETAVSRSDRLTLLEAGVVTYDGFEAPIWLVKASSTLEPRRCRIFVEGGIHGHEPAGTEWTIRLIEMLSKHPEAYAHVSMEIIPIANPWGWSFHKRENQNGGDINRDFSTFRFQESKILKRILKDNSYDLMLDHHEDEAAEGFYVVQYAMPDRSPTHDILNHIRKLGFPIQTMTLFEDGIISAPMFVLWYLKWTQQLPIAKYFRTAHSKNVYTIESPTHALSLNNRVKTHKLSFEILMAYHCRE